MSTTGIVITTMIILVPLTILALSVYTKRKVKEVENFIPSKVNKYL